MFSLTMFMDMIQQSMPHRQKGSTTYALTFLCSCKNSLEADHLINPCQIPEKAFLFTLPRWNLLSLFNFYIPLLAIECFSGCAILP